MARIKNIYNSKLFSCKLTNSSIIKISLSKKIFKRAVDRNRIKRVIREGCAKAGVKKSLGINFYPKSAFLSYKHKEVYNEILLLKERLS